MCLSWYLDNCSTAFLITSRPPADRIACVLGNKNNTCYKQFFVNKLHYWIYSNFICECVADILRGLYSPSNQRVEVFRMPNSLWRPLPINNCVYSLTYSCSVPQLHSSLRALVWGQDCTQLQDPHTHDEECTFKMKIMMSSLCRYHHTNDLTSIH